MLVVPPTKFEKESFYVTSAPLLFYEESTASDPTNTPLNFFLLRAILMNLFLPLALRYSFSSFSCLSFWRTTY